MATNDIKITQLPNIDVNSTDNSLLVIEESGTTFNITKKQLAETLAFKLTDMPEVTDAELDDATELLVHTLEQSKITLADFMKYIQSKDARQRASMRLATSVTQTVTDDATPIVAEAFDTAVTATSEFTVDPATNSITYIGPGASSAIVNVGLNVTFPGTEEVEFYAYINNVEYSSQSINAQGRGAGKPVEIYWSSDIALVTNDKIDFRVRNADSGSFDLQYLRSTFRVDIDYSI